MHMWETSSISESERRMGIEGARQRWIAVKRRILATTSPRYEPYRQWVEGMVYGMLRDLSWPEERIRNVRLGVPQPTPEDDDIVALVRRRPGIMGAEVIQELGLPRNRWRVSIMRLMSKGRLRTTGSWSTCRYWPVE